MSDIEVDSLPPPGAGLHSGSQWHGYSPSQTSYSSRSPTNVVTSFSRDNLRNGDNSRTLCHPSDSSVPYQRASNILNSDFYRNSTLVSANTLTSPVLQSSYSSQGYNFSHRNNSDDTSNQSYSYNGSNSRISTDHGLPSLSSLSLNSPNPSFVFNRPASHTSNPQNRLMQLQNSKYPDYKTVAQRVQSYAYSTASIRNTELMSEAGFFGIRDHDFVRCFHCGIGLRNWEEDDDPYVEHCRWSPNCQYMKIKKGQAFIDAVQEAVRKVQLEEALVQSDTRDGTTTDGSVTYSDLTSDGDSHEAYPASVLKKNPLLCNAAQDVIEKGYLPRVVKKAVDSMLQNHGLDSLTSEGIERFIKDLETKGEKVRIPAQQETEKKIKKTQISEETKKKLEEQNREIKEKISCVICCEAERAITFLPCGHLVCCAQCAPACNTCAVCRKEIKGTVKVSLR